LMRDQAMLQRYNLHGIALNQLNRKVEERRDKRPEMTDLKGSGAWEEVPDQILAVHREHRYKPWMAKDDIEVHILKQRLGPVGAIMEAKHGRGCFQLIDPKTQTVRVRRDKARFSADEDEG
jgi:replicative DNA helicase